MNNFNKLLILVMVALVQSNISAMDNQESAEGMIAKSKRLINDLKEYRKCRGTQQGCPPELVQRVKVAGMRIAAGTAALGVAVGVGVYGVKKHLTQRELQGDITAEVYEKLAKAYRFNTAFDTNRLLISNTVDNVTPSSALLERSETGALKAAIAIAHARKYKELAKTLRDGLKQRK